MPYRRLSPLGAALAALYAALVAAGCTQDHSVLAVDPPTTVGSSSAAGAGGAGGAAGLGGAGGEGGAGGDAILEPAGPTQLTVVNGVNDYDYVKLCFVPYPDGDGKSEAPWPPTSQGLAFAGAQVVEPISSVIPEGTDVRPYIIAGNLGAAAGKSCAEVLALAEGASPPVLVAPLAVLPKEAFTSDRSLLLVATGCVGGPGHTDESEKLACGSSYKPDAPTAGLVALGMSRIKTPGRVALQVVNASAAMPTVDIHIKTGEQMPTDWLVAPQLTQGAIGPKPPFDTLKASSFGAIELAQVTTTAPGNIYPTSVVSMSSTFMKSAIKPSDFVNGEGFVLVAVGGYPGSPAGPWWHALSYALVRGDP